MQTKTYTRRENAKRAAVAAGIPAEQVQITVHKSGDDVRFGWERKTEADSRAQRPRKVAANTPAAAATKKRPVAPAIAEQREERNGIKRPRVGGLCAAVWQYLDEHPSMTAKDVRVSAEEHGWNVNNVTIEFYQWRKFNGLSGRVKVSASR